MTGLLPLVRRRWPLVVVATIVAAGAGYVTASRVPPTYESTAQLLAGPIRADYNLIRASGQLAQTYADLAVSGPLLESTATDVGMAGIPLDGAVRATANDTTRIVSVRVRNRDSALAARIANTLAEKLVLVGSGGPNDATTVLQIVNPATPAAEPIAPQIPFAVTLSAAGGLFLGLLLIALQHRFNRTVQTPEDINDGRLTIPFLGSVRAASKSSSETVSIAGHEESYRLLAMKALLSGGARSLLVTGVESGDGSERVAAALAAVSTGGRTVCLLDADHVLAELTPARAAAEGPDLTSVVSRNEIPGLSFPPHTSTNRSEFKVARLSPETARHLDEEQARDAIARLSSQSDLVIVAAPPVLSAGATLTWAKVCDVALIVAAKRVSQERFFAGVEALKLAGVTIAGTVFVDRPRLPLRTRRPRMDSPADASRVALSDSASD